MTELLRLKVPKHLMNSYKFRPFPHTGKEKQELLTEVRIKQEKTFKAKKDANKLTKRSLDTIITKNPVSPPPKSRITNNSFTYSTIQRRQKEGFKRN